MGYSMMMMIIPPRSDLSDRNNDASSGQRIVAGG